MKTYKVLSSLVATLVMLSIWWASTYAYWHQNWHDHDFKWSIENIEKQDLDSTEIDLLKKQYEEEMMANELYTSFYEKYGIDTFKNIAESEARHMDAVKVLLDRYEITTPTNYDHIQSLYESLKAKWNVSLKDALEVWVTIEKVDIDDIIKAIKITDNDDIKTIFLEIWWASYNHMRWFVNAFDTNNLVNSVDYSDYLSSDDLEKKWPIKTKLAEKLKSEWVELPERMQSDKKDSKRKEQTGKKELKNNKKSDNKDGKNNRYKNDNSISLKNKYKATYKSKYWSLISKMDDTKLNTFIEKIDSIVEKVNIGDYSDVVKEKYNAMLLALREIAVENLDENQEPELDFESLFN